jgi:hydroxymethylglutaryl-CoA synthase
MIKPKKFAKVGIIGFGGYVPKYRLKLTAIAEARGKPGEKIEQSLGIKEKAVAGQDEDTLSLAVEAGQRALYRAKIKPSQLGAVLVGSESHPYAVKPTGTIVADILGIGEQYFTADLEFACKAGTTAMILIAGLIEAGLIEAGLAIGADVAQAKPGDALEYTAAAGAAAIILANQNYPWQAKLEQVSSFNSDTADFWRRAQEKYPDHGGRFTGEPGYYHHVIKGTQQFLQAFKEKIDNFDQVVLHMPNAKFPQRAAAQLGVKETQLKKGFLVEKIGNPYSASAMLGLVKILEQSRQGERVLLTSYGSGAGSDSFSLSLLRASRLANDQLSLTPQLDKTESVSYSQYLMMRGLV